MDFTALPLNTKSVYTVAADQSGCKIYIPVDSNDDHEILEAQGELKNFLASQPAPVVPIGVA